MKAQLLVLSAAGLLLAANAHASPAHQQRFVDDTRAQAYARLADRGVDLAGKTLSVRLAFGGERVASVGVAKSSGSSELDAKAVAALRNLKTGRPPTELVGRVVVLTLGEPAAAAANSMP